MTSARRMARRLGRCGAMLALALLATIAATTAAPAETAKTTKAKAPAARHWSGTGNTSLGTVKLTYDGVVRWTASGGRFALTDRSGKLKVSGRAKSGQSFVVRRTYRGVRVRAKGHWTLTISPLPAPKPVR